MPSDRIRVLLDSLGPVSEATRRALSGPSSIGSSSLNPLGLRFLQGARVIDLLTGQAAVVQFGTRDVQTNGDVYRVQLADASVHYRTREQLEPASPAVRV